jgi:phosphonoacetate hydrolase
MITDDRLMRSETILGLMSQDGIKTAAVTAKDKLRLMLCHGLHGVCFSSERADAEIEAMVGRARPDMYSGDLSLFVLDAWLRLLTSGAARLL